MVVGPPSTGDSYRNRESVYLHRPEPPGTRRNTMKRITILAAAGALVATPALGAWAAFASTDDGSGRAPAQVRVDDRRHHGEIEPGDDHGRHHHRHGADDGVGDQRHNADDPAGDVRHSGEV